MKFCLLKHDGTYRFYNQDPFEYIKKKDCKIVEDYDVTYNYDWDFTKNDLYISPKNKWMSISGTPYSIIFFNKSGISDKEIDQKLKDKYIPINKMLNILMPYLFGSRNFHYYSNALIIKNNGNYDYNNLYYEDMNKEEVKLLKSLLDEVKLWYE